MNVSPLRRYFDQPEALPEAVRSAIAARIPNEPIRLYALVDLNDELKFTEAWVVVTERHIHIARPASTVMSPPALSVVTQDGAADSWKLTTLALADVDKLDTLEGVTTGRLHIRARDERLLASLHYTRRQSRAVGNLQFVANGLAETLRGATEHAPVTTTEADEAYRDAVTHGLKDAKATFDVPKMGVMVRLLRYLIPHKARLAAGFGLAVLLTSLQLTPPYLTKVLVDDILKPVETGTIGDPKFWLWVLIGGLAAAWTISELTSFIRLRIMALTGERIATQLRMDIYSHMQRLSLSFYASRTTGSLITRVSSDTDRLWDFLTFGIIDMVVSFLQIIGVATALFLQDAGLATLVLMPLPVMTLMFYWHSKQIQTLYLRIWRKWSAVTGVLSDVIPGVRVVKAFAQEDHEVRRFQAKNTELENESENMHRVWTRFWPTVVMLMHTCSIIVWAVGAPRVLLNVQTGGREGLPLGVFIAFTGYMWSFWGPVQQLGMMSRTINRVATSASRVFEVLDTVPTIVSKPNAVVLAPMSGNVTFDHVTFSYDGVRNVINGVSFEVKPGEMIGLVGRSGGGKTSLANLICRFYDVKAGAVRLDGVDVRDLELSQMRRQIGVVLQEPYLFHGTIAENIAYGSRNADLKDIIEAAKAANAHEFICNLVDGYETHVGERGQTLSGGERQRVSIARAILHDPRVLILDEATSSVDTETEKKIQEALSRLVAGRTTFAIAHRLSTLSAADRLFVMEDGKLIEQGTHQELLERKDGAYARLHRTQAQLHALMAV